VEVTLQRREVQGWVGLLCCIGLACCGFRTGNTVLIPDGYVGWVRIYYGEAGAPSLRKESGSYLVVIDNSGSAQTSSIRNPGYGSDEYFYISSSGVRTKLKLQGVEDAPNDMVHDFTFQSAPREVTLFFVGPRAAVKTTPRPELAH
jgi:hypothetical protein